jgi:hypothetical protein
MCLVFVRLDQVNASVIVPVSITDHCVSLDFSMVKKHSLKCVRQFFTFSTKQQHVRCARRHHSMERPEVAVSSDER